MVGINFVQNIQVFMPNLYDFQMPGVNLHYNIRKKHVIIIILKIQIFFLSFFNSNLQLHLSFEETGEAFWYFNSKRKDPKLRQT